MYVCILLYAIFMYKFTRVCINVYMCMYVYIYTCVCMCTYIHVYVCMHVYMYGMYVLWFDLIYLFVGELSLTVNELFSFLGRRVVETRRDFRLLILEGYITS